MIDRASVSLARERVRAVGAALGFPHSRTEQLALAVSELAQNQLDHARAGQIAVRAVTRRGVAGIEIEAADRGDGVRDLAGVLEGRVAGRGLGAGLQTVRRVAEELDADLRAGEGTVLTLRCFAEPVPHQPEVAVLGRALERISGDHAVVRRGEDVLVLAVIDGAGHGPAAREAAEIASGRVDPTSGPAAMIDAMHTALLRTRGASATVLRFDLDRQTLTIAGVGNVSVRVATASSHAAFRPQPGLLGSRRSIAEEEVFPMPTRAVVLAFTDGISSRADPRGMSGRSAVHIAHALFAEHAKPHDDALLAVVR